MQNPSLVEINLDGLEANANLFLTDQEENELARSDNPGNADEEISQVLDAGTYFVLVRSNNGDGNPFTFYDLEVASETVPDSAGDTLRDAIA